MKRLSLSRPVRRVALVACSLIAIGGAELGQVTTAEAGGCGRSSFARAFGGGMISMPRPQSGNHYSAPSQHRVASSPRYVPMHGGNMVYPSADSHKNFPSHSSVVVVAPTHHSNYQTQPVISHVRPVHEPVMQSNQIQRSVAGHTADSPVPVISHSQAQPVVQPVATSVQPAATPVSPNVSGQDNNAQQQSALRMLESIGEGSSQGDTNQDTADRSGIPTFTTARQPEVAIPSHVGVWQAKLPNSASVVLELRADRTFRWVATSGGKTSSFAGSYTLETGRLRLQRSNDNGQLDGTWTANGTDANRFKVAGANDSGLEFVKVPNTGV